MAEPVYLLGNTGDTNPVNSVTDAYHLLSDIYPFTDSKDRTAQLPTNVILLIATQLQANIRKPVGWLL